jgi:hypothetical protein
MITPARRPAHRTPRGARRERDGERCRREVYSKKVGTAASGSVFSHGRSVDPCPAVFSLRPRFLVGHRLTPVHPKWQLVSAIRTKGGELIASRPGKGSESGSSRNGCWCPQDMLLGDLPLSTTRGGGPWTATTGLLSTARHRGAGMIGQNCHGGIRRRVIRPIPGGAGHQVGGCLPHGPSIAGGHNT